MISNKMGKLYFIENENEILIKFVSGGVDIILTRRIIDSRESNVLREFFKEAQRLETIK